MLAVEEIHSMSPFISSSKTGKLIYGVISQDSGCPETRKVVKEGEQKGNFCGKVW